MKKIAVLVGSLRKESLNKKIAKYLMSLENKKFSFEFIEIGHLPFYNQDIEDSTLPESWLNFRKKIKESDAVLFVTPEYNRSVPAVLKNAIDVGSRPSAMSVWNAKPCAVISASTGAIGGFGANHHLRQSLVFLNMITMAQPEAYISRAGTLFSEDGHIINDDTKTFLSNFLQSFGNWVDRHS